MRSARARAAAFTAVVAVGSLLLPAASGAARFHPAGYVNPFNGTEPGAADFGTGGGAGNTFPGAVLPFGMVQLSPDTLPGEAAFGGGYTYSDSRIRGFSLKHMSGPGCAAYQDVPITPTTQPIVSSPAKPTSIDLNDSFASSFDHKHESAAPGAYEVTLNPGSANAIQTQLTATTRTGALRFTFPRTSRASVLLNASGSAMGASDASVHIDPAHGVMTGSVASGQFCYQQNRYRLYFVAHFNRPFAAYGTWRRELLLPGTTSGSDTILSEPFVYQPIPGGPSGIKDGGLTAQTGGYVTFDTSGERSVEVRVGLSFVSLEGARANLAAESDRRSFGALRAHARRIWNGMLGRVRVSGGSRPNRRIFYTQLYHALIHPSTFSDADGRYVGFDGAVHSAAGRTQYADFSGWDTYRTQMPLLAILAPRTASDIAASLLADAQQSGALPKWSQANDHTHVMVGDPADPLIAGAYAFGARSFDVRAALAAMIRGATRYGKASTTPDYYERPGLPDYLRLGYVPYEDNTDGTTQTFVPQKAWGSTSTTLEYAIDDFTVARLAAALCERATSATFQRRSGDWRNVFNAALGLMQPRNADGSFRQAGPTATDGFVEGDAAQYTLFVPHDPAGLFSAFGGRRAARSRLDAFFQKINAGPSAPYAFLGNEPTLDTPWLYDWVGQPYKTQRIVRRAVLQLYADTPAGMPGNDDLGAMSAWWVFGALGLYPAVPGTDLLALGSPLFPRVSIELAHGTLRILAPRAAPGRPYVQQVAVDRAGWRKPWLRFSRLSRGATVVFALARHSSHRFGARVSDAPASYGPAAAIGCRGT